MTLAPIPSSPDFRAMTSREQAEQADREDVRTLGTGIGAGWATAMRVSSIVRRSSGILRFQPGSESGRAAFIRSPARRPGLPPVWLYGAVVLTGAWLIFWVQPLAVRGVLPVLGGSPAVWNTAMVFFQAALLGGYALAHCLARCAAPRAQLLAIAALWAGIALSAPVGAVRLLGETPDGLPPTLWLLATLAGSLGLAFVAVSTLTPLVQHWLARAGTGAASADPYFLYSASNAGSAGALIAFPFVIEPLLGLTGQAWLWSAAALMLAPVLFLLWRPAANGGFQARDVRRDAEPPGRGAAGALPVGRILALSAVPSALLLGVTRYVTTDVAAVPLLWILPLGLYLATFVHAFARRPAVPQPLLARLVAPALIALAILYLLNRTVLVFGLAHLLVFVLAALYCHGELARLRPPVAGLTRFYLLVSTGGLIGGMLVALVAPAIFVDVYEYPIALALVAALLPRGAEAPRRVHYIAAGAALAAVVAGLVGLLDGFGQGGENGLSGFSTGLCLITVVLCAPGLLVLRPRPALLAAALLAVLMAPTLIARHGEAHVALERTFFGTYRVTESGGLRSFYHGTTLHGAELRLPDGSVESRTTYYAPDTPYGDVMAGLARRPGPLVIGLAGLGTGSLACYARPGDEIRIYEIDPAVVRLARTHFAALRDCAPDAFVGIGDARLLLARDPASFDFLTVDAFSSDAIPVHLLTLEALRIYLRVLAPEGVLAVHISNRHIDLEPVIAALAARTGLAARSKRYSAPPALRKSQASSSSHVVVLARDEETLLALGLDEGWVPLGTPDRVRLWTDDYTSLVPLLRWW
ncbi:MAG: fused MFS/spermidine synthase [Defluviicoccus sp.]|nr:fused MFS/spermidine synthase [Defluviicoccus sp.]